MKKALECGGPDLPMCHDHNVSHVEAGERDLGRNLTGFRSRDVASRTSGLHAVIRNVAKQVEKLVGPCGASRRPILSSCAVRFAFAPPRRQLGRWTFAHRSTS